MKWGTRRVESICAVAWEQVKRPAVLVGALASLLAFCGGIAVADSARNQQLDEDFKQQAAREESKLSLINSGLEKQTDGTPVIQINLINWTAGPHQGKLYLADDCTGAPVAFTPVFEGSTKGATEQNIWKDDFGPASMYANVPKGDQIRIELKPSDADSAQRLARCGGELRLSQVFDGIPTLVQGRTVPTDGHQPHVLHDLPPVGF
jgi:hypothetical protein